MSAPEPAPQSALGAMLELSEDDLDTVGELFLASAGELGLDGEGLFEALRRGYRLDEALRLPAGTAEVLYGRAHRWFTAGRADRAEPLFRVLCMMQADSADNWVGYGVCLRLRDAFDVAAAAFEVASVLRPEWPVPLFHAAELAMARGDWTGAGDCLARFEAAASATEGVPPQMAAEARRLRVALTLHEDQSRR